MTSAPAAGRGALAWLMARPNFAAPIVSASRLEWLEDIMVAADLSLPVAAIDRLEVVSRQVSGRIRPGA